MNETLQMIGMTKNVDESVNYSHWEWTQSWCMTYGCPQVTSVGDRLIVDV